MERETPDQSYKYPYAHEVTYRFLQAAITEGAHLKVPPILAQKSDLDPDRAWARWRNMVGIYYSTDLTLAEIGHLYGFGAKNKRERVRQIIKNFLRRLWENCSGELQDQYRLSAIIQAKPLTEKTLDRYSFVQGGARLAVLPLFNNGKTVEEIVDLTHLSEVSVRQVLSREKRRKTGKPSTRVNYNQILEKITHPPKDPVLRQQILNEATRHMYQVHRKSFMLVSDCCQAAGWKRPGHKRLLLAGSILKAEDIPTRVAFTPEIAEGEASCSRSSHIILVNDFKAAVLVLGKYVHRQKNLLK